MPQQATVAPRARAAGLIEGLDSTRAALRAFADAEGASVRRLGHGGSEVVMKSSPSGQW